MVVSGDNQSTRVGFGEGRDTCLVLKIRGCYWGQFCVSAKASPAVAAVFPPRTLWPHGTEKEPARTAGH